jgi:hypothetical protein
MSCRGGFGGVSWPDGRPLIDQPMRLILAFNVVFDCEAKFRKKD